MFWRSGQLISWYNSKKIGIQNCDKPTESKYCCAAFNGTLTQDGLNGFCDCDARVGSAQPLQFGGDASAITTIGVTTSLIAARTPQRSSAITTLIVVSTTQQPSSTSSPTSAVSSVASSSQSPFQTFARASTTLSSSSSTETPNLNNRTEPTSSSMPKTEKTVYPNNDKAVIVGASVGTSIALICLAALGFYIFHRKLQAHRDQSRKSKVNPHLYSSDPYPGPGVQELFGGQRPHELPAEQVRNELPGDLAHYKLPSAGAAWTKKWAECKLRWQFIDWSCSPGNSGCFWFQERWWGCWGGRAWKEG